MKEVLLSLALCLGLAVCALGDSPAKGDESKVVKQLQVTRVVHAERPLRDWFRGDKENCDGDKCKPNDRKVNDRADSGVPDCLKKKSIIDAAPKAEPSGHGAAVWILFAVLVTAFLGVGVAYQWRKTYAEEPQS